MKYENYRRYSKEELIEKYQLTPEEQVYLLDELLAIEEYVYENNIKEV